MSTSEDWYKHKDSKQKESSIRKITAEQVHQKLKQYKNMEYTLNQFFKKKCALNMNNEFDWIYLPTQSVEIV